MQAWFMVLIFSINHWKALKELWGKSCSLGSGITEAAVIFLWGKQVGILLVQTPDQCVALYSAWPTFSLLSLCDICQPEIVFVYLRIQSQKAAGLGLQEG